MLVLFFSFDLLAFSCPAVGALTIRSKELVDEVISYSNKIDEIVLLHDKDDPYRK